MKLPSWCPFQTRLQERDRMHYPSVSNQEIKSSYFTFLQPSMMSCVDFSLFLAWEESTMNCLLPTSKSRLKTVWGWCVCVYSARQKKEDSFPIPLHRALADWIPLQQGHLCGHCLCASIHGWERLRQGHQDRLTRMPGDRKDHRLYPL